MATATKTSKSLQVPCIECGASEAITIDLNDLRLCTCSACGEEFSPTDAMAKAMVIAEQWKAVCRWIDAAPINPF